MLPVSKLMGGLSAILSICWIPAWMALSSVSRPSKSSMALTLAPETAGVGRDVAPPPMSGKLTAVAPAALGGAAS